ncbi:MAG: SusC/RagA family TonB-linked outer membrane protein [Flaviramulus sp.]|nr:SusC/RagA family TonB-linked outer membrane protein [Flaviramulus sp.]NNC51342.1 SusC/RagA family TonB-linked outer membrane protein [Flaviramulus sp.]
MKTKFSGILTLLLAFVVQLTFAQEKTISGTVSDGSGLPLPGATVLIKGTSTGTSTDFDGKYSIQAAQGSTLVFSFVGYTTKEATVGASNSINVTLQEDAEALEEVVIVGYGLARQKKTLTYQAESVDDAELIKVAPTRAASALAGKVAGLQINVQSNGVNPSTQVLLRGLRSISQNNSALIVIDGSIASQGAFDDLNPNDIASLNVLKGATAAALYGSDAGNGAIIVETKKGKIGEAFRVGINSTSTFENVAYMPRFQTEYGTGWQGAYDNVENTNWGPRFDGQLRQIGPTFPAGYPLTTQMVPYSPVKDNLLDFYNTGTTFQNTLYVTGGTDDSSFYISVGDQETDGIVPDDSYDRNTFKVNASKKIGDVKLSLNSNYLTDKTNVVGGSIGDQGRPLYWFVLNTPANIPLSRYRDWDNPNSYAYADNYFNAYYQNPYWGIGTNRSISNSSRLNANMTASWDIKEWLNFTTRFGINTGTGFNKNWRAAQTYNSALQPAHSDVSSFVTDTESTFRSYTTDALLSSQFDITDSFSLSSVLGATNTTNKSRSSSIAVVNLSIPDFYDVSNGTGQPTVGVNESFERTYGFFADLTFGYKDFLFLNVSGRYDFTSTLPKEDNSYFYPAAGLSFVASDAFPDITDGALSYLKLTASNSTVYNDVAPYATNETFSQSNGFPFGSLNGFFLSGTAVDAGLSKEKINTTEVGANLAFFKNRLTIDAAYFITKSTDLITFTTPSVASSAGNFLTNIGEIEGTGLELTVGGTILKSDDFSWDVNVNYTQNEQTVKSISEGVNEITITSTGEVGIFAIVGEEFPQMKASSYVRDPQGRVVIDPASGNPVLGDLKNLGKTTPDYIVGLTSSVNYKGFTLSATMDYRTGHVYYEQGSDAMEFTGRSLESVSANRKDFVFPNSVIQTGPGTYVENTNIPITDGLQDFWTNTYNEIKENYVKDATAFKIRELALNYTLPSNILEKLPVHSVRFGVVARNPFTWLPADNKFSDPEFNNSNSNAIGIGGYFQSPPTKSVGFNVNIEF